MILKYQKNAIIELKQVVVGHWAHGSCLGN